MIARGSGLVVEVTDGIEERYRGALAFDLVKVSVIRLALGAAADLRPRFLGRAVVALARDPAIMAKSGGRFATWDLAHEYGFDDVDGTREGWGAHAREDGLVG